jgi:hypothetical protein
LKVTGIILSILLIFSACAFAASFGKLEIQVPSQKCKIYIDNHYMGQGHLTVKLKPGKHKIKVLENGKVIYKEVKLIAANKYLAIKAQPAVTEKESLPSIPVIPITAAPYVGQPSAGEPPAVAPAVATRPEAARLPENEQTNEFNIEYYSLLQEYLESANSQGGIGASLGLDCGWSSVLRGDASISIFSGTSKDRTIHEGTLGISNLDLGILYKFDGMKLMDFDLSGLYAGLGLGSYNFTHDPSDKVLRQYSAMNYKYEESIANNYGFYFKFGYRFVYFNGYRFDCGIKSVIVNTTASSTLTNKITKVKTDDSLPYSLPITTLYFGLVF